VDRVGLHRTLAKRTVYRVDPGPRLKVIPARRAYTDEVVGKLT